MKRWWIPLTVFLFVVGTAVAVAGTRDEIKQCRQKCATANNDAEAVCEKTYEDSRAACLTSDESKPKKTRKCLDTCTKTYTTCLEKVHAKTDQCLTGCGDIE